MEAHPRSPNPMRGVLSNVAVRNGWRPALALGVAPISDLHNMPHDEVFLFGPYKLFVAERLLKRNGEPVPIGSRAMDILIMLIDFAGEIVSHNDLIARAWPDVTVGEASLTRPYCGTSQSPRGRSQKLALHFQRG